MDPDDPDSERMFGDMHTGVWMQKARLVVGETQTPIGIVLYSDKTHALQGMQVYPLYSEFISFWLQRSAMGYKMFYSDLNCNCGSDTGQSRQKGTLHQRWMAAGRTSTHSYKASWELQGQDEVCHPQNSTFPR